MKRGNPHSSDELQRIKCSTSKCRSRDSMYQKAGLAASGVRVVTRSKARAAAEAAVDPRHRCSESVVDARTSSQTPGALEQASAASEMQLSQPHSLLTAPAVKCAGHTSTIRQSMPHLPAAVSVRPPAPITQHYSKTVAGSLQQQPADDLKQLDVTFASSAFVHPSLLQHAGVSTARQPIPGQQCLKDVGQSSVKLSSSVKHAVSHIQHVHPQPLAADQLSMSGHQRKPRRRVMFAPGPLDPQQHLNSTPDGHPAAEGVQAVPVRRASPSYALDLTKGNVLFLENLLGTECQMSVTRLKRRVGLLPPIRPSRPYVGTGPGYQNGTAAATQELHSSAAEAQAVLS